MNPIFIEFTIVSDSSGQLAAPRKGIVRFDQITTAIDISSGNYTGPARTQITLEEDQDYLNDADKKGGIIRGRRTICVQEDYEEVKARIDKVY